MKANKDKKKTEGREVE